MNNAMLKEAVDEFNHELAEVMVFDAVKYSPTLLYSMMQRARAAERPDLADAIIAACEAEDDTPAHKLFHNQAAPVSGAKRHVSGPETSHPAPGTSAKCIYLVRPDDRSPQVECGQPATHRAADNRKLLYCQRHADEVAKRFQVIELSQKHQPKVSQHILP